jgi:hypothetical protein
MLWRGLLGRDGRLTGIYARWHVFEEKREAIMAIETAVLPLIGKNLTQRRPQSDRAFIE